jgi:hypothetical protein
MAQQAFVNKVWRESTAINLKSTGVTTVIPAQTGKLIPRTFFYHSTLRSGAGTGAALSIGSNSATWDNLYFSIAGFFDGGPVQNQFIELLYNATSKFIPIDLASGLKVNVTTASTHTTDSGIFYFEGIIIP